MIYLNCTMMHGLTDLKNTSRYVEHNLLHKGWVMPLCNSRHSELRLSYLMTLPNREFQNSLPSLGDEVHGLFQSELTTECDPVPLFHIPVPPLSINP